MVKIKQESSSSWLLLLLLSILLIIINDITAFTPVTKTTPVPDVAAATNFPPVIVLDDDDDDDQDLTSWQTPSPTKQQQQSQQNINNDIINNNNNNNNINIPIYQLALAGAIATGLGDAAVHPLDCIKTLQQSDEFMGTTIPQAVAILVSQSSVAGFYRGLGTYVFTDAVAGAIKFGTYETLKQQQQQQQCSSSSSSSSSSSRDPWQLALWAGLAFVASSLILVPGELLKQQLQMGQYSSLTEAVLGVWNDSGFWGFYTGYAAVCLRDVPYTMMELSIYDCLKEQSWPLSSSDNNNNNQKLDDTWAAAITGGVAGFATTPLDTIKTKLMTTTTTTTMDHGNNNYYYYYGDIGSCLSETVHQHGVASLFCGSLARVAWLLPFTALYLPLFDGLKRILMEWNKQQQQQQQ